MKKEAGYLFFIGIAFELTGLILGFAFLGLFLDKYLESGGLVVGISVIFGFFIWLMHLIYLSKTKWNE